LVPSDAKQHTSLVKCIDLTCVCPSMEMLPLKRGLGFFHTPHLPDMHLADALVLVFADSTVECQRSEVADVYCTAWVDGGEFPRGQVQEDAAQHQREPDRRPAGEH